MTVSSLLESTTLKRVKKADGIAAGWSWHQAHRVAFADFRSRTPFLFHMHLRSYHGAKKNLFGQIAVQAAQKLRSQTRE
jgi:hypothetical protein